MTNQEKLAEIQEVIDEGRYEFRSDWEERFLGSMRELNEFGGIESLTMRQNDALDALWRRAAK